MAEENVEIVRRIYDAVARGDNATVLAAYDAEVEFDFSRSPFMEMLDRPIFRGMEGLRSFNRERFETWETMANHLEELIDAGEQVVTVVSSRGRGRTSGAHLEMGFLVRRQSALATAPETPEPLPQQGFSEWS